MPGAARQPDKPGRPGRPVALLVSTSALKQHRYDVVTALTSRSGQVKRSWGHGAIDHWAAYRRKGGPELGLRKIE